MRAAAVVPDADLKAAIDAAAKAITSNPRTAAASRTELAEVIRLGGDRAIDALAANWAVIGSTYCGGAFLGVSYLSAASQKRVAGLIAADIAADSKNLTQAAAQAMCLCVALAGGADAATVEVIKANRRELWATGPKSPPHIVIVAIAARRCGADDKLDEGAFYQMTESSITSTSRTFAAELLIARILATPTAEEAKGMQEWATRQMTTIVDSRGGWGEAISYLACRVLAQCGAKVKDVVAGLPASSVKDEEVPYEELGAMLAAWPNDATLAGIFARDMVRRTAAIATERSSNAMAMHLLALNRGYATIAAMARPSDEAREVLINATVGDPSADPLVILARKAWDERVWR
jgi:hypothetical protein